MHIYFPQTRPMMLQAFVLYIPFFALEWLPRMNTLPPSIILLQVEKDS